MYCSIFAGLAILCNLLLMLSWTPAALAFYGRNCQGFCCGRVLTSPTPPTNSQHAISATPPNGEEKSLVIEGLRSSVKAVANIPSVFLEKTLPQAIIKTRFVWVVLLGSLIMGAIMTVFYHPKLKLPNKEQFQLFRVSKILFLDTSFRTSMIS